MSSSDFSEVLEQLPSHLREQVYSFAQFLLTQNVQPAKPKECVLGLHKGMIETRDDFDAPLPDEFC